MFTFGERAVGLAMNFTLLTKTSSLQKFGANFAGSNQRLFSLIQHAKVQLERQCCLPFIWFDSFSMIDLILAEIFQTKQQLLLIFPELSILFCQSQLRTLTLVSHAI